MFKRQVKPVATYHHQNPFKGKEKCDSQFIVKGLAYTLAHKVTQITKLKSCIEMHLFLYVC
jgi:hypothetical protein